MDNRYTLAKERLSSLTTDEINRIIDNQDKTLWDTFNYNEGKFCPIAIAMNLHNTLDNPTDENVKIEMAKRFNPTNIFKGTKGEFYTTNRQEDIIRLCKEILQERGQEKV